MSEDRLESDLPDVLTTAINNHTRLSRTLYQKQW